MGTQIEPNGEILRGENIISGMDYDDIPIFEPPSDSEQMEELFDTVSSLDERSINKSNSKFIKLSDQSEKIEERPALSIEQLNILLEEQKRIKNLHEENRETKIL